MRSFFPLLLLLVISFIFLTYGTSSAYATSYIQTGVLVNPSASYPACGDPSVCTNLGGECWNDERAGVTGCNGNACIVDGQTFGDPWTKYRYNYCAETLYTPETDTATCAPVFNSTTDLIYSDADKCIAGETVLRPGFCDGSWGGGGYKKCCSSGTGTQCQNYSIQDPYYPPEGVCPGGNYVPCGYGSYPACNDPNVCGGPSCNYNRTYNQCCGSSLSQSVQEYTYSDGSGVCNYVVGACNQSDPACAPTPTPTPVPTNDASTCTAISVNGGNPVIVGRNYPATVSMRNDGDTNWIWDQPNPYRLGSQDPQDNNVWSLSRVDLPSSPKAPGTTATFNFNVWAPTTAGTYSFNWRMVKEGIHWFGSKCFYNVAVSPAPTPTPTPIPFTYTLTNGGDRSIIQGSSTTNTITATLGSGTTQLVNLSVSGCPSGVTCSLSPTSGNPTYTSSLTMSASSTAATGTFPITVTGTSSGLSNRTSTFNLIVNPALSPPAPTASTPLPCINAGYNGSGVTISWNTSTNPGVTYVDIDNDSNWANGYYHKAVSGSSTTADNFNGFAGLSGVLTLNPNTTYYFRTWNGTQNSAVNSFSIPSCADLTVDSLSPTSAVAGNAVSFSGRVLNSGSISAGASSTRLRFASVAGGSLDTTPANQPVAALAAGGSQTASWASVWTASGAGNHTYEICADTPANAVLESSEVNNCTTGNINVTSAPAFDYSLSNSGNITLTQGSSGSNTITRNYLSGTSSGVTISVVSGLPAGATAAFTANPCSPTCSSTLTISTLSSTPTGSYPISVTGSPLGVSTTPTNFTLTVNPSLGGNPWFQTIGGDVHSNTEIYTR